MPAPNEILELKARTQRADAALERARVQYEQSEQAAQAAREALVEAGLDPEGDLDAQIEDLQASIDELLGEIESGLDESMVGAD